MVLMYTNSNNSNITMSSTLVKKLDDNIKFGEIPEPPKTKPTLAHQKEKVRERISVWFNVFKENKLIDVGPSKNETSWIAKNYENIHKWITNTYGNEEIYKKNTLRNHLEGLANSLLHIDKYKYKEAVRPMFNEALAVQKKIDIESEDSMLTDKEVKNFVHYPEIVRERDRLYEHLQSNPNDKKTNIYHLILAINTYIPPLRLDWIGMKFWPERVDYEGRAIKVTEAMRKKPVPNDNVDSYLHEYTEGQWAILINNDKVSAYQKKKFEELQKTLSEDDKKEYQRFTYNLADDIVQEKPKFIRITDGKLLNKIITQSLKHFNRTYVLTAVKLNNEPMGETSYSAAFRTLFADVDNPRTPTQNLIRKAYINHWYEYFNLSEGTKIQIALRMRHSTKIASKAYRKINVPDLKGNFLGYTPKDVPAAPASLPRPKKKEPYKPKEYSQKYRDNPENKPKIKAQRSKFYEDNQKLILAKKQLNLLHKGLVLKPTKRSIETYGLVMSDKGIWTSDVVDNTEMIKSNRRKPTEDVAVEDVEPEEKEEKKEKIIAKPTGKDRVTRSKTKAVFGSGEEKKKKYNNCWVDFCKELRVKNPTLSYKEVLKLGKIYYKPKPKLES